MRLSTLFQGVLLFVPVNTIAAETSTPAPHESKALVPPVRYESPFATYPYGGDVQLTSWRDNNELVRQLGGWSAFAKGQVPDEPARASETVKSEAVPGPAKATGRAGHGR
jgi:hypothetical protein